MSEPPPTCDHGVSFDEEASRGLGVSEIRRRWPRRVPQELWVSRNCLRIDDALPERRLVMRPEPIAFHCPRCDKRWANPAAVHPPDGFASIYNQSEPMVCESCSSETRDKLRELTRLTEEAGGYDQEERFLGRKLHCYCMATLTDGRGCIIDRDEHEGKDHAFPPALDWKTPVTADEYRADLETLSGGETFRQAIERMYPGMLKDKP